MKKYKISKYKFLTTLVFFLFYTSLHFIDVYLFYIYIYIYFLVDIILVDVNMILNKN